MAKANVRDEIIAGGLDVFHRKGFHASTIDNIVESAGVPKGSFYNHFKSKEDLALEAINRYRDALLHTPLADPKHAPVERLRNYFQYLTERFVGDNFEKGCLLGNFANEVADHSPAIRVRLAEVFAEWTDAVATVIRDGQQRGEITNTAAPERLAGFLINASEGAIVRTRCTKDRGPMDDFHALAFTVLAGR